MGFGGLQRDQVDPPATTTMERPTPTDVAGWDEEKTLVVYYDLGLTLGGMLWEWKIASLKYFKLPFLKRGVVGECGSPSMAPTVTSRRMGATPEIVQQLPMLGTGATGIGKEWEAGLGEIGGNNGNGGRGDDSTAQVRFSQLLARVAMEEEFFDTKDAPKPMDQPP